MHKKKESHKEKEPHEEEELHKEEESHNKEVQHNKIDCTKRRIAQRVGAPQQGGAA